MYIKTNISTFGKSKSFQLSGVIIHEQHDPINLWPFYSISRYLDYVEICLCQS